MAPPSAEDQPNGHKRQPVVLPAWNRGLKLSAQKPTQKPAAHQAPKSPLRSTPGSLLGGPRRVPLATAATTGNSTTPARHPAPRCKMGAGKAGSTQRALHDRLAAAQHPTPEPDQPLQSGAEFAGQSPAMALAGLHARFDAMALNTPKPQRRSGVSFGSPQVQSYHAADAGAPEHSSDMDDGIITPIGSRNSRRENVGHTPFAAPWMHLRGSIIDASSSAISDTPAAAGQTAPPSTPTTCPPSAGSFAFGGAGGGSAPSPAGTPTLFVDVDTPSNAPGTALHTPKLHLSAKPSRVPASPVGGRAAPATSEARQLLNDVNGASNMADMGSIKLLSPVRATKRVQGVLQGAVKVLTPVRRSARTATATETPANVVPMLEATNFCFMGNAAFQPGPSATKSKACVDEKGRKC